MKTITVYTDGACSNNGKANARGGIGIYFPNAELKNLSVPYTKGICTNQKTELYAILTCIRYIRRNFDLSKIIINIVTDSMYSINCVCNWSKKWSKNGWIGSSKKSIENLDSIKKIYDYYRKYNINFKHVRSHTGKSDFDSIGNDAADKLATRAVVQ
jgi:ribonuclease HI